MADNRKQSNQFKLQLAIALILLSYILTVVEAGASFDAAGLMGSRSGGGLGCKGTIGECLGFEEEFDLGEESHRRILAATNYISYGALNKNRVPCSRRGASYYNCRPGAQANPYRRGCSTITRCRR